MVKLRYENPYWTSDFEGEYEPGELVYRALEKDEYDRADANSMDQAVRIDSTRACISRLINELYALNALDAEAVARIADLEPAYVREAPP